MEVFFAQQEKNKYQEYYKRLAIIKKFARHFRVPPFYIFLDTIYDKLENGLLFKGNVLIAVHPGEDKFAAVYPEARLMQLEHSKEPGMEQIFAAIEP